jgi:imidazolonepropionase-like amidohydrolase
VSERMVVRGGFVLSLDPEVGEIPGGEILVEDGKIAAVGRDLAVSGAEEVLAVTETPDEPFAPTLTHRDVLEFATIDGARACALAHRIGSITPGKDADLVAGRAVKRHGELLGQDVGRLLADLQESRDYLLASGGMLPEWADARAAA